MTVRLTRRTVVAGSVVLPLLRALPHARAQGSDPRGKIAFVQEGDIWAWTPDGTDKVIEDGNAQDPTWDPEGDRILYVRSGGSYSNLIIANVESGRVTRLTDNEGDYEEGSPDYVASSAWAVDPVWSEAGIVCYISDAESETKAMQLWILDPGNGSAYIAASDGGDAGPIEHVSIDANAVWVVYTVLAQGGAEGGTTYVALRDINTGTTYPIIDGPRGAFDPAISPDGNSIVASIRDEAGMSDLWLFDRETDALTQLTNGSQATNAVWSPDGEWVAYLRWTGSGFELWALPVDTATGQPAGEAQRLVDERNIEATSGLSWVAVRR
jgi:TolB protein